MPDDSRDLEQELEDIYLSQTINWGLSPDEARRTIRDAISSCKEKGIEEGTAYLRKNYGDHLIHSAKRGDSLSRRFIEKAREDGASDADIAEWWNLHDLQRRMIVWSEAAIRYASFLSFRHKSVSADESMRLVRLMFPMYGDPRDNQHVHGDDRPLPHELRGRVDRYREKRGAAKIKEASAGASSFNEFVRSEVRAGRL